MFGLFKNKKAQKSYLLQVQDRLPSYTVEKRGLIGVIRFEAEIVANIPYDGSRCYSDEWYVVSEHKEQLEKVLGPLKLCLPSELTG